eukprot:COSAG01_NODE_70401_length_258_cov_1.622642_1_plen_26_part_01
MQLAMEILPLGCSYASHAWVCWLCAA